MHDLIGKTVNEAIEFCNFHNFSYVLKTNDSDKTLRFDTELIVRAIFKENVVELTSSKFLIHSTY